MVVLRADDPHLQVWGVYDSLNANAFVAGPFNAKATAEKEAKRINDFLESQL